MTRSKTTTMSQPETVVKHELDPFTQQWKQTPGIVVVASKPFREGSFRYVYQLRDLTLPQGRQECVAKLNKHEHGQAYFREVEMQLKCKNLAAEFSRQPGIPKMIDVVMPWVIEFPARSSGHGGNLYMCVEPYLHGKYTKYSNNFGYVSHDDPVPHAFSHWSWVALQGKGLVCDIQGVGNLYTDPQIHSNEGAGIYKYGLGDHGMEGVRRFFGSHRCNDVCRAMGLPGNGANGISSFNPPKLFKSNSYTAPTTHTWSTVYSPQTYSATVPMTTTPFGNTTYTTSTPLLALPSTTANTPTLLNFSSLPSSAVSTPQTLLPSTPSFNDYSPASSILSKLSTDSVGYYSTTQVIEPSYFPTATEYSTTYYPELMSGYQLPITAFSTDGAARGGYW